LKKREERRDRVSSAFAREPGAPATKKEKGSVLPAAKRRKKEGVVHGPIRATN